MEFINKTKMMVGKMGSMFVWARPDTEPTPVEKIAREKLDKEISDKSQSRAIQCWNLGCNHYPHKWIREVQFDVYDDVARINKAASVTTDDYVGPVPGFCFGHLVNGPSALAKEVYFDRPEITWGFRPRRYVIVFTDGTKEAGDILSIVPTAPLSAVSDIHTIGEN